MYWRLTVLFLFFIAPTVMAQSGLRSSMQRAGTWEGTLSIPYQGSESTRGANGSAADLDGAFGIGGSFTYHLNNHFALSGDISWTRPDYSARFILDDPEPGQDPVVNINHRADFVNFQGRATWHFLEGPVTPFVEGTLGLMYVDSNVADGPPVTGCWWDPWWGYICRSFWSTYTDWNWTYGAGLGIRWEVNRDFALRGSYARRWIDLSNSSDPSLDVYQVDFSWRF